jgi:pimeloyl-ACP methyl ester carboxylesterase
VSGGSLRGWVAGSGAPVLLLHGGPGLSYSYVEDLGGELALEFRVAAYQQRGLGPSTLEGPHTIAQSILDAVAVLDALDWSQAFVVGHSWGGHLALRLAAAHPERLLGALAVEPIGVIGDGGIAAFEAEVMARISRGDRQRVSEIGEREQAGEASEAEVQESMRIVWPACFADPEKAPPAVARECSSEVFTAISSEMRDGLEGVAAELAKGRVRYVSLVGAGSPIPWGQASHTTVELSPQGSLTVVGGAGHFPWIECPGCVGTALRRLVAETSEPAVHMT